MENKSGYDDISPIDMIMQACFLRSKIGEQVCIVASLVFKYITGFADIFRAVLPEFYIYFSCGPRCEYIKNRSIPKTGTYHWKNTDYACF